MIEVMRELQVSLAKVNPVDTTHSRGNWYLSYNTPLGIVEGSRENPTNQRQRSTYSKLDLYRVSMGPIILENNVFYEEDLMKGSSKQAPAGWVEATIKDVVGRADQIFRKVVRVYWKI